VYMNRQRNSFSQNGVGMEICFSEQTTTPEEFGRSGLYISSPPEVRIIRQVSIHPDDNERLRNAVDYLGQKNYGKGKATAIGSLACTYVSAEEMARMLENKYPKIYQNRRKITQMQRRMAKDYKQFVQNSGRSVEEAVMSGFRVQIDGHDDEQTDVFPLIDEMKWSAGDFFISDYEKYSHNTIGLDLSENLTLMAEMDETVAYLRDEGLNINSIDRTREPHLSIFTTFGSLGNTSLHAMSHPNPVTLELPKMWVNSSGITI